MEFLILNLGNEQYAAIRIESIVAVFPLDGGLRHKVELDGGRGMTVDSKAGNEIIAVLQSRQDFPVQPKGPEK